MNKYETKCPDCGQNVQIIIQLGFKIIKSHLISKQLCGGFGKIVEVNNAKQ